MDDAEFCRLLSKKMREYRRRAALTQEQFGDMVGITSRRIRDIESGKAKGLSLSSLIRIVEFVGCELRMVEKNDSVTETEHGHDPIYGDVFNRIADQLTEERQKGWGELKTLKVVLGAAIAGTLNQGESGALSFTYDSGYSGTPLSVSMPNDGRVFGDKVVRLTPQRLEKFSESNGLGDWGIGKGSLVERLDVMTSIIPVEMAAVAREFRDIPGMDELSGRLVPLVSELCAKSRERLA